MNRPTGYTKAIDTLILRFKEKHDPQNALHKDLQTRLIDLAAQLHAMEFVRQNPRGGDHALNVGKAAARLKALTETAAEAVSKKATAAEGSFESALREHSKLTSGPFAVEIRKRVHDLKPGEKVKIIQTMIENKDGASLSAILDAPSILTGLSSEDLGRLREQYFQAACPDIFNERDRFRDLIEHVQTAIKTSISAALEYSDPVKLRALELREAEAAKAQATLREA